MRLRMHRVVWFLMATFAATSAVAADEAGITTMQRFLLATDCIYINEFEKADVAEQISLTAAMGYDGTIRDWRRRSIAECEKIAGCANVPVYKDRAARYVKMVDTLPDEQYYEMHDWMLSRCNGKEFDARRADRLTAAQMAQRYADPLAD